LIERVVLKQTEDQYPFAAVHEQSLAVLNTKQGGLSNTQWYERFNTRHDVARSVGVDFGHKVLWEYCAQAKFSRGYDSLGSAEQISIKQAAEDRYLAYLLLVNSGVQHDLLRKELQNDFTKGSDKYPENCSQALLFLDRYSKSAPTDSGSHGTAFAQKGGRPKKGEEKKRSSGGKQEKKKDYDKEYFKDKPCFKCGKKGHPQSHCPQKDEDDDSSVSSKSSKGSKSSTGSRTKSIENQFKNLKKSFAQLKAAQEDGSDSDSSEEMSHFQYGSSSSSVASIREEGMDMTFEQSKKGMLGFNLREVILLDNQSTVDIFCNKKLVSNVRRAPESLTLKSNGGELIVSHIADVSDYDEPVWFSKRAIANIFALKNMKKQYKVTYDSEEESFLVHRESSGLPNLAFKEHGNGLHFFDPRTADFAFVETVESNMQLFSKRQIDRANKARSLYASLGFPSRHDFLWILRFNQIKDCPVTVDDAMVAYKIWGPSIAALKGKTVRKHPEPVKFETVPIPKEIRELHKEVTLAIDIFFVNTIPFFVTLSRSLYFTTVTHLPNRKLGEIFKALKGIFYYYLQRGFRVTCITGDGEFASLEQFTNLLMGAPRLNLTSANEHEPFIERRIRVVKERVRSIRHSLPFQTIPKVILTHMVFYAVKLLNYFPVKGGVSEVYGPKAIMSGEVLDFKKFSLPFGSYCQVHEEKLPRNSLASRTLGAISLGPSGNAQGGHRFFTLNTSKVITRRSWDVIPMPKSVVDRVNFIGKDQPQQAVFLDRNGNPIGDDDAVYEAPAEQTADLPGEMIPEVAPDHPEITGVDMDNYDPVESMTPVEIPGVEPSADTQHQTIEIPDIDASPPAEPNLIEPEQPRRSGRERKTTEKYVPSMSGKSYNYTQLGLSFLQDTAYRYSPEIVAIVMTQLSLKAALKQWGDDAKVAVEAEAKQLHWRNSFKPVHWKDLNNDRRKCILESHVFVKKKRSGVIKARKVAGGNKQRDFISKESASSPTVATESVLLTSMIDSLEGRDVAIVDIPNAFIQTVVEDDEDKVVMRIRGHMVDVLTKVAPKVYGPYVSTDKQGRKQLLVECLNAIYGTMVASLLYYRKFTTSLKKQGYTMNPYDPCVWNNTINKKQITVCFHVDDCKVSHKSAKVVDDAIDWLRRDYESIFEDGSGAMVVHRGKEHKYLGMSIDFSKKGITSVSMVDYVKDIVTSWDKASGELEADGFITKFRKQSGEPTAAPSNLFTVDDDAVKLSEEQKGTFHTIVAKALFVAKRARPDIAVAIAFLTTRVRDPDVQDWCKLRHLIEYLRSTIGLPLILGATNGGVLHWYVDASFAVHQNMRGHTGGALTLGQGFPITSSSKQKLNTRSSTESELVGVDDMMSLIIWTRNFLKSQGYVVIDNILYQDNKSAILLERNGKMSSGKRTKHIAVRYFFVTDRIKAGELTAVWCPTGKMIADFLTKPLQGTMFKKFRDMLMGVVPTVNITELPGQ
jgi:hypothetical protein